MDRFLYALERVWNKTEAHFRKSPRWGGWFGRHKARDTDPLLLYLTHARGAEEHGVEPTTDQETGSIGIGPAFGNLMIIDEMSFGPDGLTIKSPLPVQVEVRGSHLRLRNVLNRGRTYRVPTSHLGKPLDPHNLLAAAAAGLAFYTAMLDDGEAFFCE